LTAVASSVAVIVPIAVIEQARGRALFADRPSTFFSASASRDDARGARGFSTPEAAIAAFARRENWSARGRNYEGDCEHVVKGRPRRLFCSTDYGRSTAYLRARLAPGERAFFIGPGWSDAWEVSLVLGHEDGRWSVQRVLDDVRPR
jgi:hypothetical protein